MNPTYIKITEIAEAVIICEAIRLFIIRLESQRTAGNSIETDAAIAFCRIVRRKYYPLSKTKIKRDIDGKYVPVTTAKN